MKKNSKAKNVKSSGSTTGALVLIDMEPLLEKERAQCLEAEVALHEARQKLEKFRRECHPSYFKWFSEKFGEQARRVRELALQADELLLIIDEVREQCFYTGCTPRQAYADFMSSNPSDQFTGSGNPWIDFMNSPDEEGTSPSDDLDLSPEMEAGLRESFAAVVNGYAKDHPGYEKAFREYVKCILSAQGASKGTDSSGAGNEHEEEAGPEDHQTKKRTTTKAAAAEAQCKYLYRELARRLHPDRNADLNEFQQELWHEVQLAYEARHLLSLEVLLDLSLAKHKNDYSSVGSVWRMRALVGGMQRKLHLAEKEVRMVKKNPAWNFSAVKLDTAQLDKLQRKINRSFAKDVQELTEAIFFYETKIEEWKRPEISKVHKRSAKVNPRTPAPNPESS